MDLKSTQAAVTSKTYDRNELDASTGNIYESISIMARRAVQINEDIKTELFEKLEEFATPTENLEEIFLKEKEQYQYSLNKIKNCEYFPGFFITIAKKEQFYIVIMYLKNGRRK